MEKEIDKPNFSGWREGAKFYAPCLALGLGLIAMGWGTYHIYAGIPLFLLGLVILAFFRDPNRPMTAGSGEYVAPADGKVVGIESLEETPHYEGPCERLSIFLSLLDVHVNRSPCDGIVTRLDYQPGKFLDARSPDASEQNEAMTIRMDTPRGPVTVRQVAGLVARRIVCARVVGNTLEQGERIGMIRFGSRTELYLPPGTEITVQLDDMVRGCADVVARSTEIDAL
ncbi:MAG: phosphatidylserine decarboxylase family protein [Candidatus Hydrogenedentes bacterium]|nr:phosphatidylserine decarboxylase family protein [Candidatus Hydrogenedentota bacterium]